MLRLLSLSLLSGSYAQVQVDGSGTTSLGIKRDKERIFSEDNGDSGMK